MRRSRRWGRAKPHFRRTTVARLWPVPGLAPLAPDAVALARVTGGWKPRLVEKRVLDCDPGFGAEPWHGAVAALGTAMQALPAGRLAVTVVLSNHFVRYM